MFFKFYLEDPFFQTRIEDNIFYYYNFGKVQHFRTEYQKKLIFRFLSIFKIYLLIFFFYSGFLSRIFTSHRTAEEGGDYFFKSSLPLPLASQTPRHQPGNYCRELTSAHSQQPDSNHEPLVSERKSLTAKLRVLAKIYIVQGVDNQQSAIQDLQLCVYLYLLIKFLRTCNCNLRYCFIMSYCLKVFDYFIQFVKYFGIFASMKHKRSFNLTQTLIITQL